MSSAALLERPGTPRSTVRAGLRPTVSAGSRTLARVGPATPSRLASAGTLVVRVPATTPVRSARPRAATVPARTRTPAWRRVATVAGGLAVGAAIAMLALQLRDADLGATLAAVQPAGIALALGWFALSLLAAVFNLTGFSPLRLRLGPTMLAQLAVGGLRLVAPSAVSTPAVLVRYLIRSGAGVSDAATTVAVAQSAPLVATAGVVAGIGLATGHGIALPSGRGALLGVAVLLVLALAGWVAAVRSSRVRGGLRALWRSQVTLAAHARRHPGKVTVGVLASAALTLTHVLAFAACVHAAGGSVPLLTLAAVYLGAATAGSIVPTPGGVGPVEAAMIAGLASAGLALPVATAAALLSRLVSVWIPAVPGVVALTVLRRRQLL